MAEEDDCTPTIIGGITRENVKEGLDAIPNTPVDPVLFNREDAATIAAFRKHREECLARGFTEDAIDESWEQARLSAKHAVPVEAISIPFDKLPEANVIIGGDPAMPIPYDSALRQLLTGSRTGELPVLSVDAGGKSGLGTVFMKDGRVVGHSFKPDGSENVQMVFESDYDAEKFRAAAIAEGGMPVSAGARECHRQAGQGYDVLVRGPDVVSDLLLAGVIYHADDRRVRDRARQQLIAARLGYTMYDMATNAMRKSFVDLLCSVMPSDVPLTHEVFDEAVDSLDSASAEVKEKLKVRWRANDMIGIVEFPSVGGIPGGCVVADMRLPVPSLGELQRKRFLEKCRSFGENYGTKPSAFAKYLLGEAMPSGVPLFPKMPEHLRDGYVIKKFGGRVSRDGIYLSQTAVDEALSALAGCREVLGNVANIQHAMDLLDDARERAGHGRMYERRVYRDVPDGRPECVVETLPTPATRAELFDTIKAFAIKHRVDPTHVAIPKAIHRQIACEGFPETYEPDLSGTFAGMHVKHAGKFVLKYLSPHVVAMLETAKPQGG